MIKMIASDLDGTLLLNKAQSLPGAIVQIEQRKRDKESKI